MPKRALRPIYPHNGFAIRPVKMLATGEEILHCTERKTSIMCSAMGRRDHNGCITLVKEHSGHSRSDGKVEAKLARIDMKHLADTTEISPRDILHETKMKYGVGPVMIAGSSSSLARMISRQRDEKCPDTEAVDSAIPVFKGKMCLDNDKNKFLIFDKFCPQTSSRHVAFSSALGLEVLEKSNIFITDGTFAVVHAPFKQLWCVHAEFGGAFVPVLHVFMASRAISDYTFILEQLKMMIPNWSPSDYLGDLEIGQAKAVSIAFPGIKCSFCYFHLSQAWRRKLQSLKLDGMIHYGAVLYDFWSLLLCLPFGDEVSVIQDFADIVSLLPQPPSVEMQKFVDYVRKVYVGPHSRLLFDPSKWNVSDRTMRNIPRTTNTLESSHRNLERCIANARGRSTPLLSELLKCLRQEASKLKFDKESLEIDPTYQVASQRKLKDIKKDDRIVKVLQRAAASPSFRGIPFFKAIRTARRYQ